MLDELMSLPLIATFGGIVVPLVFFLTPKDKKSDEDRHGLYPNKKNAIITMVSFVVWLAIIATAKFFRDTHL